MDTDFSPTVTEPCVDCNTPPSCTQEYKITYSQNNLVNFPTKQGMREAIHMIVAKRETTLISTIKASKCVRDSKNCPAVLIYADNYNYERYENFGSDQLLWDISFKKDKINYLSENRAVSDEIISEEHIKKISEEPIEWLNDFFTQDINKYRIDYISLVSDHSGVVQRTTCYAYPKQSSSMSFKFECSQGIEEVNVIKDRHTYRKEEAERLKKNAGVKKWSELKDNYTKKVTKISFEAKKSFFSESRSSNIGVEHLSIQGNDTRVKKKAGESIFKGVDGIMSKILGKDGLAHLGLKEIKLLGPNFNISGTKSLDFSKDRTAVDSNNLVYSTKKPSYRYDLDLSFTPLIGLGLRIDIIGVILARAGTGKKWREFCDYMEEKKKEMEESRNKPDLNGYAIIFIDLFIEGRLLDGNVKLTFDDEVKLSSELKGTLKLAIRAGGEFAARIFIVEGMLNIEGGFSGGVSFGLKADQDMVGLIAGHDGLKFDYKFEIKAGFVGIDDEDKKGNTQSSDVNDYEINWKLLEGDITLAEKAEGFIPIYKFNE